MHAIPWALEVPVAVMGKIIAYCPDIECTLYVDDDGQLDEVEIAEWQSVDRLCIRRDHYGAVPGMIWREAGKIVEGAAFQLELAARIAESQFDARDEAAIKRAAA